MELGIACLTRHFGFSRCEPSGWRPFDEPEVSDDALSAMAAHVGAADAESAWRVALEWASREVYSMFERELSALTNACASPATVAAFYDVLSGAGAPPPTSAYTYLKKFPAESNLAVEIHGLTFFSTGAATVDASARLVYPGGATHSTLYSASGVSVVAGLNAMPPPAFVDFHSWSMVPLTLKIEWTASGAVGQPLNFARAEALGGCGCGTFGAEENFGLGFVIRTKCAPDGLLCSASKELKPAVAALAAKYLLAAASTSAKLNNWSAIKLEEKAKTAERLEARAAKIVAWVAARSSASCTDCCYGKSTAHELSWKV